MKKVSVIIPCYNAENTIDQCIESLFTQTIGIDSLDIIAVDDASTDSTFKRLQELEKLHPQSLSVIHCEENGKQGAARNIGLSYSSAEYVSFVDADDWVEPDTYENMYRKAKKYDCDAVAAGYIEEHSRNSTKADIRPRDDQFYIIENDEDRAGFLGVDFGVGFAGNLYRKSMLLDNEIFFPEGHFYEDDYWFVLSMHYIDRAYIIGKDYYHYYIHQDSTIHKRNASYQLDRALMEELKLNELVKRGIYQRFPMIYEHEFIRRYYMDMLYVLFTQFDETDYKTIQVLHDNAYKLFPDYRNNIFVKRILNGKGGQYMKDVYEALDKPMTKKNVIELKLKCLSDSGEWRNIRI